MTEKINVIETSALSIGYQTSSGKQNIICPNINIHAIEGELVALVGSNGSGKSTLLKTITRILKPLIGSVFINKQPIENIDITEFARIVSYVSTDMVKTGHISVYELVALGRFPYTNWLGTLTANDRNIISEAISSVGIEHLANKQLQEISDGERQRAMIARALAQDTQIIILDEPTAYLDLPNKYELVLLLARLAKNKNKTIIFSTHDLSIAISEADKIWLMAQNKISEGAPEDLILQGSFSDLFQNRMVFDIHNGNFKSSKPHGNEVYMNIDDNIITTWTKKAIERAGLIVGNNPNCGLKIEISTSKAINTWKISYSKGEKSFNNIYPMVQYLKTIQTGYF
jgi:iron complex transport system ATP-binding protein